MTHPLSEPILAILRSRKSGRTVPQLARLLGETQGRVVNALFHLCEAGKVQGTRKQYDELERTSKSSRIWELRR